MTVCYADGSLTWQALLILCALVWVVVTILWTLRDVPKRNRRVRDLPPPQPEATRGSLDTFNRMHSR